MCWLREGIMELRDSQGLTEKEFLEAYAKKNYPRPYLTADLVVFSQNLDAVLLVKRGGHPFLGCWAFPGGFANSNESTDQTALRELQEETGISTLSDADITEIGFFSTPGRDPRGWVVSNVYAAKVDPAQTAVQAGDDAAQAQWFKLEFTEDAFTLTKDGICLTGDENKSDLAFDHNRILMKAIKRFTK